MLAVLGSLATQFCLTGRLGTLAMAGPGIPRNFAILYGTRRARDARRGASSASRLVIPLPEVET